MDDAVPFGHPDNTKGIWIECKINNSLQKLSDNIRKATKSLNFTSDYQFRPHITLGRYKNTPQKKPSMIKGEPHKFTVENFNLMKSTLTTMGSNYEVIENFS